MSLWETPTKDIPRKIVMQPRDEDQAVRTALTLPGDRLLCVKAGYDSGLFNQHTLHVFVERNRTIQTRIARWAGKLGCEWTPRFWRDELHKLPLRALLDNRPLDFAYLDLCAALNREVARWIATEFTRSLAVNAVVGLTLSRSWRASKYMKWWSTQLSTRQDAMQVWRAAYLAIWKSFQQQSEVPKPPYCHNASVDALSAFMVLLPDWDFTVERCIEYRRQPDDPRGHRMTTFRLRQFTPRDTSLLSPRLQAGVGQQFLPPLWQEPEHDHQNQSSLLR